MKYNCFTNLVTLAVANAISNSKAEYDYWYSNAEDILNKSKNRNDAVSKLSKMLKEHFIDSADRVEDFLTAELLRAAMQEVNFNEIADDIIDELS